MPSGIKKPMTQAQAKKYKKAVLAKRSYDKLVASLPDEMFDATTARTAVVPGMTRASGYFGRYRGAGAELKFLDTSGQFLLTSTGTIAFPSFNLIDVGTGPSERIGRKVTLKSIALRLTYKLGGGNPWDHVRCILYNDTQCNGAAAAVTDILQTADVDSYLNLANSDRFRVLRDFNCSLNSQSSTTIAGAVQPAGDYKIQDAYVVVSLPIDFAPGTGGTSIADVKSVNIGMLMIAENSNYSSVEVHCRIRYSDN